MSNLKGTAFFSKVLLFFPGEPSSKRGTLAFRHERNRNNEIVKYALYLLKYTSVNDRKGGLYKKKIQRYE